MTKKRYLTLAVVLILAALVGLVGWGYTRQAAASPQRAHTERQYSKAQKPADDTKRRLRDRDESSEPEDREGDSDEGDDSTATTGGSTTTTTARGTTTTTQPRATTTTTAINGAPLFSSNCVSCHGPSGTPISSSLSSAAVLTKITTGSMSSYASSLNSAQRTALANYVAAGGR